MTKIQNQAFNHTNNFNELSIIKKTSTQKNLQLPKRSNLIKTISTASIMGPCALSFGTQLNTSDLLSQEKDFSSNIIDFIKKANLSEILKVVEFDLKNRDMPWTKEILRLKKGQQVTFLLNGKWWFSKKENIWIEPGIVFHTKIANENYHNLGNNTGSITASRNGKLAIARSLGEFKNSKGELRISNDIYKKSNGYIEGVAILWEGEALDGLYKLSARGDYSGIINKEIQRLVYITPLPKDWKNNTLFESIGVFFQTTPREISCLSHKNIGILQKDTKILMTNKLKFSWKWIIDKLPSKQIECYTQTQDYLAIGIKFDDGQYLTYIWGNSNMTSIKLRSALEGWDKIETHVIQRSGVKNLGQWVKEKRTIKEDYKKYIGGSAKKIIQVLLIANTLFMRGTGKCKFANIEFDKEDKKIIIL